MNAYELADELAECIIDGSTDLVCVAQAANMLRQQADEFDKVIPQLVKANGLIENLRLRIAELEKNLHMVQRHYDQLNTQTKPLSDEEILNVAFCCEVNTVAIENDWDGTVIDFARAILKKASEK